MATQNPVDQEGTYALPEAQLDRFMFKVEVDYPSVDDEIRVIKSVTSGELPQVQKILNPDIINGIRADIEKIFVDDKIFSYITHLVDCTRNPQNYELSSLKSLIDHGASPRAGINLVKASKVRAMLNGRDYVVPDDIKILSSNIFRHRIALSYESEAREISVNEVIHEILTKVPIP
jgi:MoxR-like ATPase